MDETTVLAWLASRADAQALFGVSVGILVGIEIVKRLAAWLWPASKEFDGWWLVGAGVGAALGLGLVDPSAGGAIVGVVCGVLATGGFEYLAHALRFLPGLAKGQIPLALGASVVLCTAGCGGHAFLVDAQEAQLAIYDQVQVGLDEYHGAALAELANAEEAVRQALVEGLAEDLANAATGRLDVSDPEALAGAIVAEYLAQLADVAAERAVLADRRHRLAEVIALGRETATRAAEIEIRRFATLDAVRDRLTEIIRERARE